MKHTREQKKERLMAEAQSMIEEFLSWEAHAGRPNLTQIEDVVLRLRERLGQRMAEVAIEDQETAQPVEAPPCGTCGLPMRNKGQKRVGIGSRIGELQVARTYYYCAGCKSGLFPPQPATGIGGGALE